MKLDKTTGAVLSENSFFLYGNNFWTEQETLADLMKVDQITTKSASFDIFKFLEYMALCI